MDILKKELEDLEHRLMEKRRSFEKTGKKLKLEKEKLSDLTDALENINVSIEKRKKEEDVLNLKYAGLLWPMEPYLKNANPEAVRNPNVPPAW